MPHVKGDQNSNETVPFRTIRLSQMIFDLTQLPARNSSKEEREKKGPKCNRKNPSEAIPKLQNLNYDYFKDCDVKKRRRRTKKKRKEKRREKKKIESNISKAGSSCAIAVLLQLPAINKVLQRNLSDASVEFLLFHLDWEIQIERLRSRRTATHNRRNARCKLEFESLRLEDNCPTLHWAVRSN